MATKTDEHWVKQGNDGEVVSRRWHIFTDCSMFGEGSGSNISDREVQLLGLKQCAVCAHRASGGPALDILEGFFGEDWPYANGPSVTEGPRETARRLLDYLKDHSAFVAIRRPKDNGQVAN